MDHYWLKDVGPKSIVLDQSSASAIRPWRSWHQAATAMSHRWERLAAKTSLDLTTWDVGAIHPQRPMIPMGTYSRMFQEVAGN